MDIAKIIQEFLAICGGISIIGVPQQSFRWIAPAVKLNERVEILEGIMTGKILKR